MKSLIVEDDTTTRFLMQKFLEPYGESHAAGNGMEALLAVSNSLISGEPYQLICLDIMMPDMDGLTALKKIRALEATQGIMVGDGVKIIMTTALSDMEHKMTAAHEFCDAYLVKPIDRSKLIDLIHSFKLAET
jgi:two-component system chemotaxis response regulator CheY